MNLNIFYNSAVANKKLVILAIIVIALIVRIPIVYFFGDNNLQNEWLTIVNNLFDHGKFSFRSFDGYYVPNMYMPPLYAWFLFVPKILNLSIENYIGLILYTQAILSALSSAIFYIISINFFSKKLSLFLTTIFCFFPSYLYACGQISSISLYLFLLLIFIYLFLKITNLPNLKFCFYLGIISGLLMLLRGEFILLFFLSLIYLFLFYKNMNIRNILFILLISYLVMSPYLYRNITELNTFSITKSMGFNLWKGNNPNSNVEGDLKRVINEHGPANFTGELKDKIDNVVVDKRYDINIDNLFLNEALNNIKNQPERYFLLYLKKVFSFLFFDLNSSYNNYYNPIHLFPLIIISISSFFGMLISLKENKSFKFIIVLYLLNIFLFSLFFILPRYNLIILPMQIILTGKFFSIFLGKKTHLTNGV